MKNKKIIIIDSDPNVHKNIESIFNNIEPGREFISYYNQLDALTIFTFFHYLTHSDILFIDLALSERIVNILSNKVTFSKESPQLYLTSSYINFDQISECKKHKAILDFFPKPIMPHNIQTMVA